jgi:signal peptidase I
LLQNRKRPTSRTAAQARAHLMREIVEALLFVGLIFIIVHFAIQAFRVADSSMSPQLKADETVVVNNAAYLLGGPSRGDVVVFHNPNSLNQLLIERVIATPGDTITITASQVQVNGVTLNETYVDGSTNGGGPVVSQLKLSNGQYFLMPDNRQAGAADSRTFGPVAGSNIAGKAVLVFWPLSSMHGISSFSNVFSGIGK